MGTDETMDELQKQFDYYVAHQDEIVGQYDGRFVVIVNESIAGDFEREIDAYQFAMANYEPGTFMIQFVAPGSENYTQTFHSRVAI